MIADDRIDALNAATVAIDVETATLQQTSILVMAELPALGEDADTFEALAAKMEAENDAIESQLNQDDADS